MTDSGVLVARRGVNCALLGDYYALGSKKAQFHYVNLGPKALEAFAITKVFLFKVIFKQYPFLLSEMLGGSFARYVREFRKPCMK